MTKQNALHAAEAVLNSKWLLSFIYHYFWCYIDECFVSLIS